MFLRRSAICLALFEDDALLAVYPHSTDTENRTVDDGLAMLEPDPDTAVG